MRDKCNFNLNTDDDEDLHRMILPVCGKLFPRTTLPLAVPVAHWQAIAERQLFLGEHLEFVFSPSFRYAHKCPE